MRCLYWTCRHDAMDCDTYCAHHRMVYGLYRPMTYVEACAKARTRYEVTGDKHFVYRHKHVKTVHKGYGTSRVTRRNWVDAIFSEIVFPNDDSLVSTATAQNMMYTMMHGGKL